MTDTTKNRGGRPALALPPKTSADTRGLIAVELVKTKSNTFKVRQLQKLLLSQQQAEEHSATQAAAQRANQLLAESNELKRSEYRRRYELGQQRADAETEADAKLVERLDTVTTENAAIQSMVTTLQNQLARVTTERDTLQQANDALKATVAALQPQADAMTEIRNEVQEELLTMSRSDEKVKSLRAEFDSLSAGERTITVLERMKEILLQMATLRRAYFVAV
jgi:chromosome segregation ATPase